MPGGICICASDADAAQETSPDMVDSLDGSAETKAEGGDGLAKLLQLTGETNRREMDGDVARFAVARRL